MNAFVELKRYLGSSLLQPHEIIAPLFSLSPKRIYATWKRHSSPTKESPLTRAADSRVDFPGLVSKILRHILF
jgi:hypothetical protein